MPYNVLMLLISRARASGSSLLSALITSVRTVTSTFAVSSLMITRSVHALGGGMEGFCPASCARQGVVQRRALKSAVVAGSTLCQRKVVVGEVVFCGSGGSWHGVRRWVVWVWVVSSLGDFDDLLFGEGAAAVAVGVLLDEVVVGAGEGDLFGFETEVFCGTRLGGVSSRGSLGGRWRRRRGGLRLRCWRGVWRGRSPGHRRRRSFGGRPTGVRIRRLRP